MRKWVTSGAVAALAILGSDWALVRPCMAGFVYTNEASFAADLTSGFYLETFQSRPLGSAGNPGNFAGGAGNAYTYSASTPAIALLVFDLAGNRYLTTSGRHDTAWSAPVTLSFTGAPVFAVGGSFFFTSAGGAVVNGSVGVTLSDGTNVALTGQSNTTFWGYISTTPITSLTITPDATQRFVSIDNLYVGTSSIPTPAAATMLGLGGVLAARRRRR